MSSRGIGPALPPHMRRSHGDTNEDAISKTKRLGDKERNENRKNDSKRYRDKYDDGKYKHKDELKKKTKYVPESRNPSRSRGLERKREASSREEKDTKERQKFRRGRMEAEKKKEPGNVGPSRRSKRSKTDRTYNTDTEESSDESDDDQELTKVRDVDISEPDSEEDGSNADHMEHLSSSTKSASAHTEGASGKRPTLTDGNTIGPALPPILFKDPVTDNDSNSDRGSLHTPVICSKSVDPATPTNLRYINEQEVQNEAHESIGPALPPYLQLNQEEEKVEKSRKTVQGLASPSQIKEDIQADDLPSHSCIGPALPPHLRESLSGDQDDIPSDIGPLPPCHMKKKIIVSQIGPALPPHLQKSLQGSHEKSEHESHVIGPSLPLQTMESFVTGPVLPPVINFDERNDNEVNEDSSDDEVLGPLLPEEMTKSSKNLMIQAQLERNAAAIKRKFEEKDTSGSGASMREEWMLALPPEGSVDLGLGPRTFRARGAPEKGADRSMWTDTPADKVRKEEEAKRRFELGISSTDELKQVAVSKELSGKDKSMNEIVKKHKRSKESLLESHHKKIKEDKKKKEKSGVKQERRPFNRETDLKTNVFDDAQKKAIYKKAQLLDSRFSGGESKFL